MNYGCVLLEGFVDIGRVGGVFRSLFLGGAEVSLGQELSSGADVLSHHLAEEDVVDFDIMRRQSVVEEGWWEHHSVLLEPELSSILHIEGILLSCIVKSASSEHHHCTPAVTEQGRVVKWPIAETS